MSRSNQSSRSTSSYSSGKIPLSFQSDPKQTRYDDRYLEPRYASTTLSEPRSGYSSSSSTSSKSGRSYKSDKVPLSISQGGSSSRDDSRREKTSDERYYPKSFLDSGKPQKKPLSFQTKDNDSRYYTNSSYYR